MCVLRDLSVEGALPVRNARWKSLPGRTLTFLHHAVAKRCFALLEPEKRAILLLTSVNAALAVAQTVEPILFGSIVNLVARADVPDVKLATFVLGWVALGLGSIGCSVAVALNADKLALRQRLALIERFYTHVLHLPQGFHVTVHSGRLMKIMTDGAAALVTLWLPLFRDQCTAVMMIIVALPVSLVLNWRLASVMMITVLLFGALTFFVMRRTWALQEAVEVRHTALVERTADVVGNLPVVQSFARIGEEAAAVRRLVEDLLRAQLPVLSWWALAAVATRASSTVTLVGILVLGLWLKSRGMISIGEVVAFMSLAALLTARLQQVVTFLHQISLEAPKLRAVFDVLDRQTPFREVGQDKDPGRLRGFVAFNGASYAYGDDREAVSDLRFTARPGEMVALVGATGSGKTTTLSLLYRAFDPSRGSVTIDGIDIRDMPLEALRRNVSVVFQEPMLLCRSFDDNLRIGKPEATRHDIDRALTQAQARDFVAAHPNGAATVIGQGGRALSGGERQRLAIARALVKDAPILIFDEATSALDSVTERDVQEALAVATADRTIFVIAHRLSTVRNADRVLVFEQGRIVETGTFAELLTRNGVFARLVNA